jgi:hypothetical protein
VKPARLDGSKWKGHRQCGNEVARICAIEDTKYWCRCTTRKQSDRIRNWCQAPRSVWGWIDPTKQLSMISTLSLMLETETKPSLTVTSERVYSLFGDGEGQGYTVRLSFDICQSHHQESAARMPQIFDHRSMSVSHTTRNLWHVCRKIIPQSVSCSSSSWNFNEICSTDAADFLSACMSKINFWQTCLRLQKVFIYQC